jgi:hypothetical protein
MNCRELFENGRVTVADKMRIHPELYGFADIKTSNVESTTSSRATSLLFASDIVINLPEPFANISQLV